MSHEVETMAYANAVPWHGLGARVDGNLTPAEMCSAAGLDWSVDLCPMYARTPSGIIAVEERQALVRSSDNKVLTVTGDNWHPMQNSKMLGFMSDYVSAGGATLETAGSLRGGKIVWGLAKMQHSFDVSPGDRVEGYLLITSPHEVGKSIQVRTTTVRVVCANTMALAMGLSELNYRQNHLSDFDFKRAEEQVGNAHEHLSKAESRAKTLHSFKISLDDALREAILPIMFAKDLKAEDADALLLTENQPKTLQALIGSINNAPGAEPGTGWGILNGVTHWADHVAGRGADSRLFRSWVGDTARMKTDVEETLYDLATV